MNASLDDVIANMHAMRITLQIKRAQRMNALGCRITHVCNTCCQLIGLPPDMRQSGCSCPSSIITPIPHAKRSH